MTPADIAAFRALALAATEGVTNDGYRLRAPDGELIVEYKHSLHPNAWNDGALFTQARPMVLALLDHIADLETRHATLVTAVREAVVRERDASDVLASCGPGDGLCITDEESAEQQRAIVAERDARAATDALLGSVTP